MSQPNNKPTRLIFITGLMLSVAVPAAMFAFSQAPTSAFATASGSTRTLAVNAQQCIPTATALGQANVRFGPSTNYNPPVGMLVPGQGVQVTGRLNDNSWYRVVFNNTEGWVFGNLVATTCMLNVPVVQAPPGPNPTPIPGPNQANFRADANTVAPSQCTTLRWEVSEVAGVWLIDGQYQNAVGGRDSRQVCPTVTSNYNLRVQRRDGSVFDNALAVQVVGVQPPAQNANFRADAYSVSAGQCTTLRWEIDGVRAVYFWDGGNQQGVAGSASRQVCPNSTATYRLQVITNSGDNSDSYVVVNVNGSNNQPDITFSTSNTNISVGLCTNLAWQISGPINSAALVDGVYTTVVGPQGNVSVCPRNTSTYVLRTTGQDGRIIENTVTINVFNGPIPGPTPQP